jgi:16S rRNA (cytosine1402-N4)-methyltransferase
MVREVLEYLRPERGGVYFDGTVGAGGHTEAILSEGGSAVLGVDQDAEALEVAGRRLERFGDRVRLVAANFAEAAESDTAPLAGALLDLGVSSHQIDEAARGFSFREGTPLDMRMGRRAGQATAADLLNELPQDELANVFYRYGEERGSRRLAAAVVRRRGERPFRTSDDLNEVLDRFYGPRITVQDRARIYQALRIAVNDELGSLEALLNAAAEIIKPGGRLVIMSYHSLEDRLVKNYMRSGDTGGVEDKDIYGNVSRPFKPLSSKAIQPTDQEIAQNPRARSARLRIAERQ